MTMRGLWPLLDSAPRLCFAFLTRLVYCDVTPHSWTCTASDTTSASLIRYRCFGKVGRNETRNEGVVPGTALFFRAQGVS